MRQLPLPIGLSACVWAAPPGLPSDYPLHALTHAKIYVTPGSGDGRRYFAQL